MGIKDMDAYVQGGLAYKNDITQNSNPYPENSPSWESWDEGWRDAVPVPGYDDSKEHKERP